MAFKIKEESRIGCGICQSICPKCFLVENGLAKVLKCDSKDCDSEEVIESCPSQAIIMEKESEAE